MPLIKGDFNGNGRSEIPVSSPWGLGLLELSGNSLGSPMMASNGTRFGDWLLNTADNHFDLVGDLDGDGRDEVLVTSPWGAAVLKQEGATMRPVMMAPNGTRFDGWLLNTADNRFGPVSDFDGDGEPEILISSPWGIGVLKLSSGTFQVLMMAPNGTRFGGWLLNTGDNHFGPVGDVDGDGRAEILFSSPWGLGIIKLAGDFFTALFMAPNGSRFGDWLLNTADNNFGPARDYDGDGRAELLISSSWGIGILKYSGTDLTSFIVAANGTRISGWLLNTADNRFGPVAKYGGDRRDEILLVSPWGIGILGINGAALGVNLMFPNGTRFGGWLLNTADNHFDVVGDYDGDGKEEIVVASPWGLGILDIAGGAINAPMMAPNGTRFGGWLLNTGDNRFGMRLPLIVPDRTDTPQHPSGGGGVVIDPGNIQTNPPLRRSELTVPVASRSTPADTDVFESADGSKQFVLPRYALAFDKAGLIEEPRIAIMDRDGMLTLVVTLNQTPSPAANAGASELPHVLTVTLRYRVPVVSGGDVVQEISFPSVLLDETGTVVSAGLPLTTPGQRQQIVAALSSLAASATLVVGREILAGVPTGEKLPDGAPGFRQRKLLLEWIVPPAPIVLSEAQGNRLGGGSSGVQALIRHRIAFGGKNYSYWQDPAQPERFHFLPDRFLLARAPEGNRRPLLRVRSAAMTGDDTPRIALEFQARPVVDSDRLDAARPQLETAARERGGTGALDLEIMPDPQPVLRLALPQNGVPNPAMTVRSDADIDLETGVAHGETMSIEDFQLIYQALFGGSLTLLRGEVRAAMSGGDPEDVPLELRIDKTAGDVLNASPGAATAEGLKYSLTNAIESPVRIDRVAAAVSVGDKLIPLRVEQFTAGQRLAPGASIEVVLVAPEPIQSPGPNTILFDQSDVAVEPDKLAIWNLVFDRSAAAQMTRSVTAEAVPLLFSSLDRPGDRVAAFVVTVEHGGTVRLTEAEFKGTTTVRIPIEPLITGAPVPPIRYRTETWWGSGGIGVSPWRETDGDILFPLRTAPA
jgi:hypothetical protein